MRRTKPEIITFKADASLLEAMKGISNRSEFIRTSVLSALENACPLCKGTGILSPNQKNHWKELAKSHFLDDCTDCHEVQLVCSKIPASRAHKK